MSVQRDGQVVQLVCDGCGTESDTSTDFHDLVREVKDEGWKVVQRDGKWAHFCETCEPNSPRGSALERAQRKFGLR